MSIFLDAAYHVLDNADHPMSAEDITRLALDRGFLITRGATPAATMSASLYMDIKEKGAASRFIQIGPNQFGINGKWEKRSEPGSDRKPQKKEGKREVRLSNSSFTHGLLDREIIAIHTFLNGNSEQLPTSEKICDWVTMCYSLGLYSEGGELFSYVDLDEVNSWYYDRTKKMARLCTLHVSNKQG